MRFLLAVWLDRVSKERANWGQGLRSDVVACLDVCVLIAVNVANTLSRSWTDPSVEYRCDLHRVAGHPSW